MSGLNFLNICEIFNNIPLGIFLIDSKKKIKFANSILLSMTGFSDAEIIKKDLFELIIECDVNTKQALLSNSVISNNNARIKLKTTGKDKSFNYLSSSEFDKNLTVIVLENSIDKRTPDKHAIEPDEQEQNINSKIQKAVNGTDNWNEYEKKLEFERDKFWQYLNLVGTIIVALDTAGNVVFINNKGCEILGYEDDYILGKNWVENFIPDSEIEKIESVRNDVLALKQGERDYREGFIKTCSGELRCIYWSNTVLYNENNDVIGTLSSGEDITSIKNNEMKIHESETRLKDSEKMSRTGHWVRDIKTSTYIFSDELYRIFGLSRRVKLISDELLRDRFHPEDAKRIIDHSERCIQQGKDYRYSGRLLLPGNKIKYIKAYVQIVKDKNGNPVNAKGIMSDVTETALYEQELIKNRNTLEENQKRLRKAEEIANIGHWERNYKDNTSHWSDEVYRILGKEPQSFEASDKEYVNYIHPDDFNKFLENSKNAREGTALYDIFSRVISGDGKIKYIRIVGDRELEKGKLIRTFGTIQDISSIVETENELKKKNKILENAEAIAHIGHWERNFENNSMYWSDEIFRLIGYEPGSFEVVPNINRDFMHTDDWDLLNQAFLETKEKGTNLDVDIRASKKNGEEVVLKIKGGITSAKNKALVISGTVEDITKIKKHYEEVEYMNFHDTLTGLYNRRYFDMKFDEIDNSDFYPVSIIIADVNGLKMINDTFGHSEGDNILKLTADILKNACDESDIIARIGGDDFAVLLPRTIKSQAELVISDIYELLTKQTMVMDVSISMGLAVKIDSVQSKEEVVKEAEDNMYTNKLYDKSSKRGDMLQLIMDALYARSNREEMHSERVSQYCMQMAQVLRLPVHKVNELSALGLLHDIGKIAVKDSVLNKPGRLNDEEWEEIKKHPESGFKILNNAPGMLEASKYILAHHERWDGSGYPNGLISYDIPLQARIIAIADAFDAMRSKRPYKDPLPLEVAIGEIKKGAGTQFDPKLAKVFVMEVLKHEW